MTDVEGEIFEFGGDGVAGPLAGGVGRFGLEAALQPEVFNRIGFATGTLDGDLGVRDWISLFIANGSADGDTELEFRGVFGRDDVLVVFGPSQNFRDVAAPGNPDSEAFCFFWSLMMCMPSGSVLNLPTGKQLLSSHMLTLSSASSGWFDFESMTRMTTLSRRSAMGD